MLLYEPLNLLTPESRKLSKTEVTTHSIEIILPNNVRQRFYNPNVEQPWIKRVGTEEK